MIQKLVDGRRVCGQVALQSDLGQDAITYVQVQIDPLHHWAQQFEQRLQLSAGGVVIQDLEVLKNLLFRNAPHADPGSARGSREHESDLKHGGSWRQEVQTSGDLVSGRRLEFAAKQKRQCAIRQPCATIWHLTLVNRR